VDARRIAVSGCSLGGIESLFAAQRGAGIVDAIDFSGTAMTWATNTPLQERMKAAAREAKVHVYPPNGTSAADGHAFRAGGEHRPWGDEVLALSREAMGADAARAPR
jgi:hypothetical protein